MREISNELEAALDDVFTYHAPSAEQMRAYAHIREAGREFAEALLSCCPSGPDRSRALTCVRDAVMIANASVAVNTASVLAMQRGSITVL